MIWIFIVWYFGCFCEIYVNDLWSFSQHWQPSKIDSLFMYKIVKRTRWKIYHQSNQRQCPTRWHSNDAVTMQQGTCNKWTNRPIWRHRHVNVSTKHADTTAVQHTQHHGNTAVIPRSFKMKNVEYICTQSVSKTSQQRTNIITTGRTVTLYTAR